MKPVKIIATVVVMIAFQSSAFSHEGHDHHGKPVEGIVLNIEGEKITVKSQDKTMVVVVDDGTKIMLDDKPTTESSIKIGQKITAHGNMLGEGQLAASMVEVLSVAK